MTLNKLARRVVTNYRFWWSPHRDLFKELVNDLTLSSTGIA
jgi:hypothetical protein